VVTGDDDDFDFRELGGEFFNGRVEEEEAARESLCPAAVLVLRGSRGGGFVLIVYVVEIVP